MKLEGYVEVNGAIILKEGLRIGGTKEAVGIGETDNPIIRHPVTRKPFHKSLLVGSPEAEFHQGLHPWIDLPDESCIAGIKVIFVYA